MIQEPMQGMEGAVEGTQCHCRTCVRRPFSGHCGILLEAWADETDEVQVIEDALELYASMRARPEMNYYYYYYYHSAGDALRWRPMRTAGPLAAGS